MFAIKVETPPDDVKPVKRAGRQKKPEGPVLTSEQRTRGVAAIVYAAKARNLPRTPLPLLEVISGCLMIGFAVLFLAGLAGAAV